MKPLGLRPDITLQRSCQWAPPHTFTTATGENSNVEYMSHRYRLAGTYPEYSGRTTKCAFVDSFFRVHEGPLRRQRSKSDIAEAPSLDTTLHYLPG